MIILIDNLLTPKHSSGLTISDWFRDPFLISVVVGFIHILGIKLLFKNLRLNKEAKRPKLVLLSIASDESSDVNLRMEEEEMNGIGVNALGDKDELLLE